MLLVPYLQRIVTPLHVCEESFQLTEWISSYTQLSCKCVGACGCVRARERLCVRHSSTFVPPGGTQIFVLLFKLLLPIDLNITPLLV